MEFPHIGKNCSKKTCNRLDFLPFRCDSCKLVYCSEHFTYDGHSCTIAQKRDVQVPVCPLCGIPVPTARDQSPDISVGQHIDQFCRSDKTKIFTNKCTFKNCKKKELVPFLCSVCKLNFCIQHRHTTDHICKGPPNNKDSSNQSQTTRGNPFNRRQETATHLQSIQGNMTEDEALAHALALSLQDDNHNHNRQQVAVGGESGSSKERCSLS